MRPDGHRVSDSRSVSSRRPAGDLIEAIVRNMRENCETLRYSTVAPSRYTVYLSAAEYARLEGLLPRLRAETIRALDEELDRRNRRARRVPLVGRLLGSRPSLENADNRWHIDFLPDSDGDLEHEQDIVVHSELILPAAPELGDGAKTRRVTTVLSDKPTTKRHETVATPSPVNTAFARMTYQDKRGTQHYDVVRGSTTIGRGGTMYPVDVRVVTSDAVSREHARIRRDESAGTCFLIDLSTHGTTVNGQAVPRGFDEANGAKKENGQELQLPRTARIGLANVVFIDFETL
jgi:pSer/pThr/pTyr-binding forkhead associated (FHA) protein